jgi:hypothetical protein
MSHDFAVGDAARLIGVEPSRIRNWQQHRFIDFGARAASGRYRFSMRDVRCLALMARLIDHGIEPGRAAAQATSIVDRMAAWRGPPLVAIFSRDPSVSPVIVPQDGMPDTDVIIIIPLAPLFAEIDAKAAR